MTDVLYYREDQPHGARKWELECTEDGDEGGWPGVWNGVSEFLSASIGRGGPSSMHY